MLPCDSGAETSAGFFPFNSSKSFARPSANSFLNSSFGSSAWPNCLLLIFLSVYLSSRILIDFSSLSYSLSFSLFSSVPVSSYIFFSVYSASASLRLCLVSSAFLLLSIIWKRFRNSASFSSSWFLASSVADFLLVWTSRIRVLRLTIFWWVLFHCDSSCWNL